MLNVVEAKDYYDHIKASDLIVENAQWQDQFKMVIMREQPDSLSLNPLLIKSFTLQYDGFTVDTSKVGSAYVNQITGIEPLSISVVFREQTSNEITNFLINKKDGTPIMPRDGTYLLPYEYYFSISAYMLDGSWKPKLLVSGEFLIEGTLSKDLMSEGGNMMEQAITFKPILSNQIKYK
ncbi:hypothetical protein MNB_SUP05-5-910 [hydrothermal vent metagenome]|uniref:Uncharacterized protein n=1 Tax=hydrothermal vent metagenome TaxID=652676 RepID=A0A1W1BR82_9ZZZZ